MNPIERVNAIASLFSVTGYEQEKASQLPLPEGCFDEDTTDAVGNRILSRLCKKPNAPRILIDTHLDEIGFFVRKIEENGLLRLCAVGGLDVRTLPGCHVKVFGKKVLDGVILAPYVKEKATELPAVSDLLLETGYSAESLKDWVGVGTPVGFAPEYRILQNGRICGKGLDNKACVAAAIEALCSVERRDLVGDVFLVLSAHEETDRMGGAAVGGFSVAPDYAMVIDVNIGRTPHTDEDETVLLGGGISLTKSAVTDRHLTGLCETLCHELGIPCQCSVAPCSTGTNTMALHLCRGGIPCVDVGLPLRAMHTYVEMIDPRDLDQLICFIRAFVTNQKIAEAMV